MKDHRVFRFAVMSDIHIQAWDTDSQQRFVQAIRDYAQLTHPPDIIVVNGDITEGFEEDYDALHRLLETTPHPTIYFTMGNHEYYRMWYGPNRTWNRDTFPNEWSSEQAVKLFTQAFHLQKPYYDAWIRDYHFIFLSGERYRDTDEAFLEDAWLSDDQLQFLKLSLQQTHPYDSSPKPIFVFLHQPLPHTVAGSFFDHDKGVVRDQELRQLLERYPEVILFSGHTHYQLNSSLIFVEKGFAMAASSSVRRPWNELRQPTEGTISESLYIEVDNSRVQIRGRRHDRGDWIDEAVFQRCLQAKSQ